MIYIIVYQSLVPFYPRMSTFTLTLLCLIVITHFFYLCRVLLLMEYFETGNCDKDLSKGLFKRPEYFFHHWLPCHVLWCSPTIGQRRSRRTGTKAQLKSWWGRTLSLLLWTQPKTSLWSFVSQSVCLPLFNVCVVKN